MSSAQKFEQLLMELDQRIKHSDILAPSVSSSPVGWHIEHCLITFDKITGALQKSDPSKFKAQFNLVGFIILSLGYIPRGKAKAPKIACPETFSRAHLVEHLEQSKEVIQAIPAIDSNAWFRHPFFGNLKAKKAVRFMEVHTKHHLKIMDDIIAART